MIVSNRENSFTGPPAMPIPYEQHKKLKKRRDRVSSKFLTHYLKHVFKYVLNIPNSNNSKIRILRGNLMANQIR